MDQKLQDVANIATIIEAGVVIISLFLILWQIILQTRLTKISNTQALVELSSPFNLELIKDQNMAKFWVSGSKKYNDFDKVEKYQYKSMLIWWLIFHENIFYQKNKNLLDKKIYASWDYDLRFFIKSQSLWLRWDELQQAFQSEFRVHVSNLITQVKAENSHDD